MNEVCARELGGGQRMRMREDGTIDDYFITCMQCCRINLLCRQPHTSNRTSNPLILRQQVSLAFNCGCGGARGCKS